MKAQSGLHPNRDEYRDMGPSSARYPPMDGSSLTNSRTEARVYTDGLPCDKFVKHPTFGFLRCSTCGYSLSAHSDLPFSTGSNMSSTYTSFLSSTPSTVYNHQSTTPRQISAVPSSAVDSVHPPKVPRAVHPLHVAARQGDKEVVAKRIAQGDEISTADADGFNALHFSACEGRISVVSYLVLHGCPVNAKTKTGETALHLAASCGSLDVVQFLLDNGSEADSTTNEGATASQLAIANGYLAIAGAVNAHVNISKRVRSSAAARATDGRTPTTSEAILSPRLKSLTSIATSADTPRDMTATHALSNDGYTSEANRLRGTRSEPRIRMDSRDLSGGSNPHTVRRDLVSHFDSAAPSNSGAYPSSSSSSSLHPPVVPKLPLFSAGLSDSKGAGSSNDDRSAAPTSARPNYSASPAPSPRVDDNNNQHADLYRVLTAAERLSNIIQGSASSTPRQQQPARPNSASSYTSGMSVEQRLQLLVDSSSAAGSFSSDSRNTPRPQSGGDYSSRVMPRNYDALPEKDRGGYSYGQGRGSTSLSDINNKNQTPITSDSWSRSSASQLEKNHQWRHTPRGDEESGSCLPSAHSMVQPSPRNIGSSDQSRYQPQASYSQQQQPLQRPSAFPSSPRGADSEAASGHSRSAPLQAASPVRLDLPYESDLRQMTAEKERIQQLENAHRKERDRVQRLEAELESLRTQEREKAEVNENKERQMEIQVERAIEAERRRERERSLESQKERDRELDELREKTKATEKERARAAAKISQLEAELAKKKSTADPSSSGKSSAPLEGSGALVKKGISMIERSQRTGPTHSPHHRRWVPPAASSHCVLLSAYLNPSGLPSSKDVDSLWGRKFEWEIDPSEVQLMSKLGTGSFGEVYRGVWAGTPVAVKKVRLSNGLSEQTKEDFVAEVEVMSNVRHPNCVLFLGACTSPPHLCIITEFCSRGSLHDMIHHDQQHFTWPRRLKIAFEAAVAMTYLHCRKNPIVHRDLKSDNFLLTETLGVKVCDFGLARLKLQATHVETSHNNAGTPAWMSPEALRGENIDEATDLFSFAIVLWEQLTCKEPWEEMKPTQILSMVGMMGKRLPLPSSPPSGCPPDYLNLIKECWDANPKMRPRFPEIMHRLWSMGDRSSPCPIVRGQQQ